MKKKEIDSLIEKFYEDKTSLDEEQVLFDYFQQEEVSEDLKEHKFYFQFIKASREVKIADDFDKRMEEKLQMQPARATRVWLNYKATATVALLVVASALVYFFVPFKGDKIVFSKITTQEGEQKYITLSDGSKVWLNSSSRLRFPDRFKGRERKVFLEGEAFFEVARDAKHPFVIRASNAKIHVLGTSFNVRGYPKDKKVEVAVLTGKVAFSSFKKGLQEKVFLLPGDGATFDENNNSIDKMEDVDPNLFAWKTRRLVFKDASLKEVIKVLERYFHTSIEIKDPDLFDCRFKGTFKEADLKEILEVMSYSMDLQSTLHNNKYSLTGKGCKN